MDLPAKLEWEECPCGYKTCKREWLTNLGTFYVGTGFEPDQKEALNRRWEMALPQHQTFDLHPLGKELCDLRASTAGDFETPQHQGQRGEDWDNGFIAACRIVEAHLRKL